MSGIDRHAKRPLLVLITQGLLLLLIGFIVFVVASAITTVYRGQAQQPPLLRFVSGLLLVVAFVALLSALFYGLAHRRRWSWGGSIAFTVLIAAWLTVLYFRDRAGVTLSPDTEADPSYRIGEAFGRASLPLAASLYAAWLYFSRKVRAFLGVPQRVQHGR